MKDFNAIIDSIQSIGFDATAIEQFKFQAIFCEPYSKYIELLKIDIESITTIEEIPYLPIEIFRSHKVYCATGEPELEFSSSGTTGGDTSTHYVASAKLYYDSFRAGFEQFYGAPTQYKLSTLLPSYRQGSSLLYMVRELGKECTGEKIMLIGVTFALLESARDGSLGRLPEGAIVIETGGMKGREYHIERLELHRELCEAFGISKVHSEYGMCELLSQAYSAGDGLFYPSSTMRVIGRRLDNPMSIGVTDEQCGLNIIDLSNLYSCSFIATGDRGVIHNDGGFEVLGRIEGEILRGCNML